MLRARFLARAALAATALLVTACAGDPGGPAGPTPEAVAPARLGRTLPDDPVRMVLPAVGAETRWTQGLDVFGRQVGRAATARCAERKGIALPADIPPAFIRFFELPDLDFVARHGLSASAEVPAVASSSGPARTGSAAEVDACRAEGTKAAATVRDLYVPLQQQWFGRLTSLRDDPAVLKAQRGLPDCLAARGVPARDEQTFMSLADARQQRAAAADLPATERALGSTYAACMRPVEAVREPARLRLRTRFLAEHAAEIRTLRTTFFPALRSAERDYGVPLVFPEP
ncbi:hypothetical protein FNH09_17715 [Streptomyces adustus]|uniref:Uncharacterized protein n=1 Tax=Streptomyces adustus TaxID=1609272 RepID=A0A5N8VCQ2_9ACTN|nr:hypothetical protein [Streptomyces adustus]MPY33031.1 hypothetical protein [Streptomyces adustus]